MTHLIAGDTAPDFSLPDHHGVEHKLSEHLQEGNVLLVFNIGFA